MTNIKNGTTPGKVTPKRKAAGGFKTTTATSSVSHADSTGSHPAQLHLPLGIDFHFQHVVDALPASLGLTRKPRTKLATILRLFLMGRNMNRFEAEAHHDHCLHSTVSTLQNDCGIKIDRMFEVVPCLRGRRRVRCKRYWLDASADNITAARALLARLERRA